MTVGLIGCRGQPLLRADSRTFARSAELGTLCWASLDRPLLRQKASESTLNRLTLIAFRELFKLGTELMDTFALPIGLDDRAFPQDYARHLGESRSESPLLVVAEAMTVNCLSDLPNHMFRHRPP